MSELFAQTALSDNSQIQNIVNRQIVWLRSKSAVIDDHTVVVLHDFGSITRSHANRIYEPVSRVDRVKPSGADLQGRRHPCGVFCSKGMPREY